MTPDGPRPLAPVVVCVEAYYRSLRGAVVRARDVSLTTELGLTHSNTSGLKRQSALSGTGASPAARGCSASTSGRLRSRAAVAASVRGRRGQIGSILRDLPRCIRGDRGPAGRRQLSRRHTERSRSPDAKRGVTETRRAPKRLVDASPRTAAADAKRGVSKCSSPGASSRATGARRRRTRPGSIPTRRCRRRGRPLEASLMLMILRNKQLQ